MKKYLIKLLLIFSPLIAIVGVYIALDPFKVLYHYDSYIIPADTICPSYDKDYISTQTFLNHYEQYHYDSYIFGNSRSVFYPVKEWSKHIGSEKCFHFDASGESVYGIEKKLVLLDQKQVPIKNALLIVDGNLLEITFDQNDVTNVKHPILSGRGYFDFQLIFFKSFVDKGFLYSYFQYLLTKKYNPDMSKHLVNFRKAYNTEHNEMSFPDYEWQIANNRDSFYAQRKNVFYQRGDVQQFYHHAISEKSLLLLHNIRDIFIKNKTNYRIVISPGYDQKKLDTADLKTLQQVFGTGNVFDFSGINEMTSNKYNYYENAHYRPSLAAAIMDSIYIGQQTSTSARQ